MTRSKWIRTCQIVVTTGFIAAFLTVQTSEISAQETNREPSITDYETIEVNGRDLLQIPLRDILYWALQKSGTIKSALLGVESARSKLLASEDSEKMSLSNSISFNRGLSLSSSDLDNSSSGSNPYLLYYSADTMIRSSTLSKKNPNGILYSLQFYSQSLQTKSQTISNNGDDSSESTLDIPVESSALTFGVSVPIYKGWGEVNQIVENRNKIKVGLAEKAAEQTRVSLLQLLAETYWNLVGLWESKKTAEKAVELSEKLYSENAERAKLGILKLIEVKQTTIQLNRNKLAVMEMEKSIQEVEDQLKILLGIEDFPFGFIPKDTPQVKEIEETIESLEKKMLQVSSSLGIIDDNLKINRLNTAKALNDDEPDLDFTLSYTLNGAGEDITSSSNGWSDQKLNTYSLGITWNLPLFDKTNSELLNQKKMEQSQLNIQRKDTRLLLRSELHTLLRNLKFIQQNIIINEAQFDLAEQILNEEVAKMKLGQSRSYLVSEAQQDQINAKLGVINARIEYEKVYFSILLKTGDIYQKYQL
ncbi:MAG: TolC family protein [Proteobacteria bacterium]|nr:TolC family protein [Pseudomonadota bacterium]